MYTWVQIIIDILVPIISQHGIKSFELNNGQLQSFIECAPFDTQIIGQSGNVVFSSTVFRLGYRKNLKSAKLTLYYTALAKKPKTF